MIQGLVPKNILKKFGESNSEVRVFSQESNPEITYVIKRIRGLSSPLQQAMFDKECLALSKLQNCEYVVKLVDVDRGMVAQEHEGWIVLEHIHGETLRTKASSIKTISEKYIIAKQLIQAMEAIHNSSIIHRDLNPNNVMISNGKIKIIDFGICKVLGESSKGTTFQFATNLYAAPEVQYHSENASVQSDIYSLGATIFYLFTKQDPPMPTGINEAIDIASGMDPELKDILIKMTQYDPSKRYDNVYLVSDAMISLFDRYLKSDEIYRMVVPYSIISDLKDMDLVQSSKRTDDILREDVSSNFTICFSTVKILDQPNPLYIFDGKHYSFECTYDDATSCFVVQNTRALPDYIRVNHSQLYLEVSGRFLFSQNTNFIVTVNNTFKLMNRIHDYERNTTSENNIDRVYRSKYGFWRDYINAMIELAIQEYPRFSYDRYSVVDNKIFFSLSSGETFEEDFLNPGDSIVYETKQKDKIQKTNRLGTYYGFNAKERQIIIEKIPNKFVRMPLQQGVLTKNYESEISQYVNQKRALDAFNRQETYNTGDLKAVFAGVKAPAIFGNRKIKKFYDAKLDDTQKLAVEKAIAAKDIFLIQGPPGTGKTNVIVEIIRQMIRMNQFVKINYKRILIVAQAHPAVDKLLEDLDEHLEGIRTIRIGDPDNLSDLVNEKYALNTLKMKWIEDSVHRAECKRDEVLRSLNIDITDFSKYVSALECINTASSKLNDIALSQKVIQVFLGKYCLDADNKMLKLLFILDGWIKQINEKDDIADYFIKNTSIIVGTCAGFLGSKSNLHAIFEDTAFECVIIDEAAKATIPELMLSIVRSKKVIMVGDHNQLPPVFDENKLSRSSKRIDISKLKDGGFRQLYDSLPDDSRQFLTTQYRMHPCIGSMISKVFYDNTIQNGISAKDRYLDIDFFNHSALVWLSTSTNSERYEVPYQINGRKTYGNPFEVSIILQYLKVLDELIGNRGYSIGIITPYKGQLDLLHRDVSSIQLKNINVEINTVDAFQGSQRDIIIYSTVRSSEKSGIGFLSEKPRLNVAFSRARSLLLIIGDLQCLEKVEKAEFKDVIKYMRDNKTQCTIDDYRRN